MKLFNIVVVALALVASAGATVGTQTYSVTYTCTGGFGPFPFNFPISDPTALTVTMNGALLPSTDYTIVPVNNNYVNGGSVTLGASFPCTSGWALVLTRVTPVTQAIQFYDNMPIPMKTFERGLDKLTEIAQELTGTGGGGASYPGVTSCGVGCLQASQIQTNGPPPNNITVGTSPGVTVSGSSCTITAITGGIITGATCTP